MAVQVEVNGTRLWFDVEGPGFVPRGATMRERPTLLVIHGGPGGFDHSYFRPWFGRLADIAQVVYVDLRDHGRSARHDPGDWSYALCADDVRAFCDAIGLVRPIVLGHSMGGFVAMLYGARHPGHAGGLVLQSTAASFDLERLAEGFRRVAGDEVAALARRDYSGEDIGSDAWARVFAAFGPRVLDRDELARCVPSPDIGRRSIELLHGLAAVDQLALITSPTLVCVGELDPVTPVEASREIIGALQPGIGRLEVIPGAGHFPWLDQPEALDRTLTTFIGEIASTTGAHLDR